MRTGPGRLTPRRGAAALLVLLSAAVACAQLPPLPDFYAGRPVYEQPFPAQRIPRGLKSLSAAECGTCHVDIYREWRQSVHAQAWSDPQFQAELHKDPGVSWMCVNCHTPLVQQLDSVVVALHSGDVARPVRRANPRYVAALREEGINCAACHVRDGAVEGPFGNTKAPHATRYNARFRSADLCLRCHQAVQAYPGKNFICTFETGTEWSAGPQAARGQVCQDCHMPPVERPLAAGGPTRWTGLHGWIGSGLPKGGEPDPGLWDSLAARIPPGVELRPEAAPRGRAGRQASWTVWAVNANAGHKLTTGDPERAIWIELAAIGAGGDTLARARHEIGQRWQWEPEVKKLADVRLAPGDSVGVTLRFRIPRRGYRLVASAVHSRISDANADYHRLPPGYVRRREVARLEVPGR